jgi:hypothetical protein
MRCTGCFKELEEEEIAYATATGSIEQSEFDEEEEIGFYASEVEPWITVLCEECGMAVHDFIVKQLQAKHLCPVKKK